MTRIADLHKKWMKDPEYRKHYEGLEEEFRSLRINQKKRVASSDAAETSRQSRKVRRNRTRTKKFS